MGSTPLIPKAFFWRRLHSLTGFWLMLFLIEHLLTNSQAALFFGDDGSGFIQGVNLIKSLPYLPVIEITLLGVPILIHMIWGIQYLREGRANSYATDGSSPALPEYPRNRAYTWQRITSWVLVIGLVAHVVQMRFIDYPASAQMESQHYYMVRLDSDEGLYTLAPRLGVKLFNQGQVQELEQQLQKPAEATSKEGLWSSFFVSLGGIFTKPAKEPLTPEKQKELIQRQETVQKQEWLTALQKRPLGPQQVVAVTPDFGTAELLTVRETFKMPLMIVLYTLFVLAACYHAFNGLWTFLITWGITLTERSQNLMRKVTTGLMIVIAFLGLAAIWGSYLINLNA